MSLLFTAQFKKQFAVRANVPLTQAKILDTVTVTLPKESVIHHIPLTATENGFRGNNPLIAAWPNTVRVHFVEDGKFKHGKSRKAVFNQGTFLKGYYRGQPSVKRSRDLDRSMMATKDMVVVDYTLLTRKVQYSQTKTVYMDYWANLADEVLVQDKTISRLRSQFLQLHIPKSYVEEAGFKASLEEIPTSRIDDFRDMSSLWFLEIYRFLSHAPSLLDNLDDDFFFILTSGLKSTYMSVGVLRDIADINTSAARSFHDLLDMFYSFQTVADTAALEKETERPSSQDEAILTPSVRAKLDDLMASGQMTVAERERITMIAVAASNLPSPQNPEQTVTEFGNITAADVAIPTITNSQVNKDTIPEGAEQASTVGFRSGYVDELMEKDMINALTGLSRGGIFLRGLEITEESDALETTRFLHITLAPIDGKETTFVLEMPTFNPDGSFSIHGVNYTMDAQKSDIPLRKITGTKAAITSYIDKFFITRSALAKHNYNRWLVNTIGAIGLDLDDKRVTNISYATQSIPKAVVPRDYSALMQNVGSFTSGKFHLDFDYNGRIEKHGKEVIKSLERKGSVVCGTINKVPLVMDSLGILTSGKETHGSLLEVLGGGFGKIPKDVAMFNSIGKTIPVVFFLGYFLGLDKLFRKVKAKVRYEPVNQRSTATDNEMALNFKDERLLIDVSNPVHSLIFTGLLDVQKELSIYNTSDFNRKDGWKDVLRFLNANMGHIKEWELKEQLFIDPITAEILTDMKEPTDLIGLFLRCVDMIKTDDAPDENDPKFMRVRGMERVAGLLYKTLYQAERERRNQPNSRNIGISLPPTIIKEKLHQDGSVQLVSEINPIHYLKEQEAVTLGGDGGRSARTLVKRHRTFHPNDLGLLSEHTPDSSKVGIRGFMPPDAKLDNLRGRVGSYDESTDGSTSLLSTTALTSPEADRDD